MLYAQHSAGLIRRVCCCVPLWWRIAAVVLILEGIFVGFSSLLKLSLTKLKLNYSASNRTWSSSGIPDRWSHVTVSLVPADTVFEPNSVKANEARCVQACDWLPSKRTTLCFKWLRWSEKFTFCRCSHLPFLNASSLCLSSVLLFQSTLFHSPSPCKMH